MTTEYAWAKGRTMADEQRNELAYGGRTWRVESEPVVIDSDGDSDLVEVWIKRGEDIEQPQ